MGGIGLVAWIGGFVLIVAIAIATVRTRSHNFTRREDQARDEATRRLYREDSQSNDTKH